MLKEEIQAMCSLHGGDINKASVAYAKKHGLPAREVMSLWRAVLSTITPVPQKGTTV